MTSKLQRGTVVPLTPAQVVSRALYLAGEVTGSQLDPFVREPELHCPTIYYRLPYPNGGEDPTAPHPASVWIAKGGTNRNVTADCVGGAAWCGGWDRKQSLRFGHVHGYNGSINTNGIIVEASGPARCFRSLGRPELGCMVVCKSGSPGHAVGHVGTVVSVPAEWDPTYRACWEALGVVDIAGRGVEQRANKRTTGLGWRGTGALFVVSVMKP